MTPPHALMYARAFEVNGERNRPHKELCESPETLLCLSTQPFASAQIRAILAMVQPLQCNDYTVLSTDD